MCYIFDSFVYNKVYDEEESFCSLGWEQFFSREETFFLLGGNRFPSGMCSGCVRDGLVSDGQVKRTRFAFQKDSFYLAKGLVLDCKRTRFEGQKESFSEC